MSISEFWVRLLETDYFFHSAIEQDYFFQPKSEQGNFFRKNSKPPPPPQEYQMDRALIIWYTLPIVTLLAASWLFLAFENKIQRFGPQLSIVYGAQHYISLKCASLKLPGSTDNLWAKQSISCGSTWPTAHSLWLDPSIHIRCVYLLPQRWISLFFGKFWDNISGKFKPRAMIVNSSYIVCCTGWFTSNQDSQIFLVSVSLSPFVYVGFTDLDSLTLFFLFVYRRWKERNNITTILTFFYIIIMSVKVSIIANINYNIFMIFASSKTSTTGTGRGKACIKRPIRYVVRAKTLWNTKSRLSEMQKFKLIHLLCDQKNKNWSR